MEHLTNAPLSPNLYVMVIQSVYGPPQLVVPHTHADKHWLLFQIKAAGRQYCY